MSVFNLNPFINNYKNLYNYEYKYLNINKDPQLRKDVTDFFKKKIIKWINHDFEFKKYNNKIKLLESVEGTKIIYNLIRNFVKKYKVNWYDLRTKKYYFIKDYFSKKLN